MSESQKSERSAPTQFVDPCNSAHTWQEEDRNTFQARRRRLIWLVVLIDLLFLSIAIITHPIQYKVAIIGTNDLHGKAFPTILFRSDTLQQYKYGGLAYMAAMISTIRNEYNGNMIYLDGGDQFQGGIQSSKLISSGQIINDFFSQAGLNASSIGNHEFDFGSDFLFAFLRNRNSSNLVANLKSERGEPNFLPNQKASELFNLPNGIKIGVIGLATIETPITTAGFVSKKFPPYQFLQYKQIVIKESQALKKKGANAVLIVSHVGDACPSNLTYSIRNLKTLQVKCPLDELTKLIDELPSGTVHGIVQGHRHRVAHQYYKGIPYMGSINGGYYFNKMELKFNKRKQLVDSSIQGPIPVCQKIFEHLGRCNYLEPEQLQKAGNLVNWKFHGRTVVVEPALQELFREKYGQKMQEFYQQIVRSEIKLQRKEDEESELSNLFTNLLFEAAAQYSPDFAIINSGGFRAEWMPGIIQQQHYYNMFPFENDIQLFEITGEQLVQSMRVVQTGRRFIQACNLLMEVTINESHNTRSLNSIRFSNGTQIEPTKIYKGVTLSYLLEGGDQFSKVIGTLFNPKNVIRIGQFRSTLKPYFKKLRVIKRGSLINEKNPRLIVRKVVIGQEGPK